MAEGVLTKSKTRGCGCVFVESWWSSGSKAARWAGPLYPMPFWSWNTPAQSASQNKTPITEGKMPGGARPQIKSFARKKKRSSPCLFFPQHFPISGRPLPRTTFYSFVIISHRTKTMLCLASQAGGFVLPLLKQSYWLSFWPLSLGCPTGIPGDNFFLICYLCFVILFFEK